MENSIALGVFGTFGLPEGFLQLFLADFVFNTSLDLNSSAIEVYPDSRLFAVNREFCDGKYLVFFSIYTYARELNLTRGGTFIGSSVVLSDSYVNGKDIYKILSSFHEEWTHDERNIKNDEIQVNTPEKLNVEEPDCFEKVKSKIKANTNIHNVPNIDKDKKILISCENGNEKQVVDFFEKSIRNCTDIGTLYFSYNQTIITNVYEKGLIKILKWSDFINNKNDSSQRNISHQKNRHLQEPFVHSTPTLQSLNNSKKENTKSDDALNECVSGLKEIKKILLDATVVINGLIQDESKRNNNNWFGKIIDSIKTNDKFLKQLPIIFLLFIVIFSFNLTREKKSQDYIPATTPPNTAQSLNSNDVVDVTIYLNEDNYVLYAKKKFVYINNENFKSNLIMYLMEQSKEIKERYDSEDKLREFIEDKNRTKINQINQYVANKEVLYSDPKILEILKGNGDDKDRILLFGNY